MTTKNRKLTYSLGENTPTTLPKMYDSALFSRKHPNSEGSQYRKSEVVPDEKLESIEPTREDSINGTRKAAQALGNYNRSQPDLKGRLEGKFSIPIEEMKSLLNKVLKAEYSQWFRYYHYSLVLRGYYRDALSEEFNVHAGEELEHAERIAMRIIGLGGYPIPTIETPILLQKPEEILQELIRREQEGISLYRDVLSKCGENEGTRQIIESNIEVEQGHLDELWRFYQSPDKAIKKAITSAGMETFPSEKQAKREYDHSFAKYPSGISGSSTPDLPEVGRDWHHESEKEDEDEKDQKESESYFKSNGEALDLLKMAPDFVGMFRVPPREKEFLIEKGYSVEDIDRGKIYLSPLMRSEFSSWMTKRILKSINSLEVI